MQTPRRTREEEDTEGLRVRQRQIDDFDSENETDLFLTRIDSHCPFQSPLIR